MKTKNNLIEAAIEVLIENPSSNMDVIAEKAAVTRRTLHRYFSSRDHMIKECVEIIVLRILIDVKMVLDTEMQLIDKLKQMFEDDVKKGQHFEFVQKFSHHFSEEDIQASFKEMGDLFYGLLDKLKSNGIIDKQLSNEWLSYVWMGLVRSANQALKKGVIAPNKVNELAWNAFSNGMITKSE
ncbi:hypothetical protein CXF68_13970 [Tenacibaculum sp. Bg11-29]|uniref:TetR/AcrR family transcriptional regulator n=1 Tax=Tenacibaculum TaxID=104267 RepID=UPI000C33BA42|nr:MULTISPECIES: TetR/AcrR family transcriptional regulator [Tenacibaculum]PKH51723.1 hypothetical protein CXF68_13970 [Tenacibaculum sp. Bg11-29]WBX74902.1 TetR/AcrR family transcriptional regulator [Tenacibaculum ovolyticum]